MENDNRLELEENCKDLSRKVAYISEMYQLSTRIMIASEKMLTLMNENGTADKAFGIAIADMAGRSRAKFETCENWLKKNRPVLEKMVDRLANWDKDHA